MGLTSRFILWTKVKDIIIRTCSGWLESGVPAFQFGKKLGISTRKGNIVNICDLMEEATEMMLENQEKSDNT